MRSMTGFGVGESALGGGKVVAEIRTVNHRYLDVRARLPKEIGDCCMLIEQVARTRLSRGRCEVVVRLEGPALPAAELDVAKARAALGALSTLRDELAPQAEVPFSLLSAVPDLFVSLPDRELVSVREAVQSAMVAALDDLDEMRAREGEALARDLRGRLEAIATVVGAIEARLPEVVASYRRRLSERVRALLSASEVSLDGARLEHEVVLYADRTDVSEELTRLRIHLEAVGGLLDEAEPLGRRLDFLLQEVGREINTIGSKSQDAPIAHAVVEAKAELERLREQVQNVE